MRIVYHHRTRATDAQGVHVREMVNAFRVLGHNVEMAALVDPERKRMAGADVVEPSWRRLVKSLPLGHEAAQLGYNAAGLPLLLSKLVKTRADFIYERYSLFNLAGVAASRITGVPLILEVNSPLSIEQTRNGDIRTEALARWAERTVCNASTRMIVVSRSLQRVLTELGIDASKMVVMPNGVNLERFHGVEASSSLREAFALGRKTVIGFAGWFRPWHGLELLVDAFGQSQLSRRDAVLLLIGDGPATLAVRERVKEHGLHTSVILTGAVTHEKMPEYLALADIAVQPAANEYCCPMKILEYMAQAKPVIAPRQDNIEELVEDGRSALLFPPGDVGGLRNALQTLVAQPELRWRLGNGGLQTLQRRGLSWERNAETVVRIIAETARCRRHQRV